MLEKEFLARTVFNIDKFRSFCFSVFTSFCHFSIELTFDKEVEVECKESFSFHHSVRNFKKNETEKERCHSIFLDERKFLPKPQIK
jgi:hypothetical protein